MHAAAWQFSVDLLRIHSVYAGVRKLLELAGSAQDTQRFAPAEGLPCCTGLLDGPTGLTNGILACGPSSDAGSAALQAGQTRTE